MQLAFICLPAHENIDTIKNNKNACLGTKQNIDPTVIVSNLPVKTELLQPRHLSDNLAIQLGGTTKMDKAPYFRCGVLLPIHVQMPLLCGKKV